MNNIETIKYSSRLIEMRTGGNFNDPDITLTEITPTQFLISTHGEGTKETWKALLTKMADSL